MERQRGKRRKKKKSVLPSGYRGATDCQLVMAFGSRSERAAGSTVWVLESKDVLCRTCCANASHASFENISWIQFSVEELLVEDSRSQRYSAPQLKLAVVVSQYSGTKPIPPQLHGKCPSLSTRAPGLLAGLRCSVLMPGSQC